GVGHVGANNLSDNRPHMGIFFYGNEHLIELNEIHHVCQEAVDAGAIYNGRDWTMRGTIIRHNYLHHLYGLDDKGSEGIYLDDMASGMLLQGNVFFEVHRAFLIGGGRDVTVENNIIIDCKIGVYVDARGLGWAKYSINATMKPRLDAMPIESEVWRSRYPQLLTLWGDEPGAPKGTVVRKNVGIDSEVDAVHKVAKPYVTVENNRQLSRAEAGFVNGEKQDFRLIKNSKVYESLPDFQPIPFEKIGLKE
ncbi:MAG: right-handed parallel beta-helix repeat-containing protein, partial [Verrucomicrobiales bacterium]|nr:right-handed parallel beta-helix repeat-containing protein [Verrucomicrobiales bacterium]